MFGLDSQRNLSLCDRWIPSIVTDTREILFQIVSQVAAFHQDGILNLSKLNQLFKQNQSSDDEIEYRRRLRWRRSKEKKTDLRSDKQAVG